MTKQQIIERLRALGLDDKEYWLITGGAMVLHGLKNSTNDIDLGCTSVLADRLEKLGYSTTVLPDGTRRISVADDIEVFEGWLFDTVEEINGFPVISLPGLLEMKRALGRKKDIPDIKLIERALFDGNEN